MISYVRALRLILEPQASSSDGWLLLAGRLNSNLDQHQSCGFWQTKKLILGKCFGGPASMRL